LYKKVKGSTYMPNIVPIWRYDYLPNVNKKNSVPVLVHSPTDFKIKNTKDLMDFPDDMPPFSLHLLSGRHDEVMAHKRNADISFDHLQGYYGVCTLESLSLGIPSLVGIDDYNVKLVMKTLGCDFTPFVRVTKETLHPAIAELIVDEELRTFVGRVSREWMEKYWNDRLLVERLIAFYRGDY